MTEATTRPRGRRHPVWAAFFLACSLLAAVLAVTINLFFFVATALLLTAAYAAWLGLSLTEYLDTVDDTTAPPTLP